MCLSSTCRPDATLEDVQRKIAALYKDVEICIRNTEFKENIPPNAERDIKTRMEDIMKRDSPIVLAGQNFFFNLQNKKYVYKNYCED